MEIVHVPPPAGLAKEQVEAVKEAFKVNFDAMAALEPRYKALTDIKLVEPTEEQSEEARKIRLLLVKTRTGTAATHKALKADALVFSRYLDGMKAKQVEVCGEREYALLEIENYQANLEKERLRVVYEDRKIELMGWGIRLDELPNNLAVMEEDVWKAYIKGVEHQVEAKKIADAKAEKEMQAALEADAKEKEELRKQKQEADAKAAEAEAEAKVQRDKNAALVKAEADRKAKVEAEAQAKAEADQIEADRIANESHRAHIHNLIECDFVNNCGLTEGEAHGIVNRIVNGDFEHLSINY